MPRKKKKAARGQQQKQAQQHRNAMARRSRQIMASVADIGAQPKVKNSKRKAACRLDLEKFLTSYFPASTGLKPFSDDQVRMIGRIQRCVISGGLFTNAFPRGFAKTSIGEGSVIWATLYGHRKFIPIFGAEADAAENIIDSIKLELSENELLAEDFPEVCHAIKALEGKAQRCQSQTYKGKQTHLEWRSDTIVMPTIPGSAASGCMITARGITAASRGMKHKRPDGTQQRPDFVLLDDPQTDESAATQLQVNKRIATIQKTILKLGGHDRRIACVMNATVIQRGDLVEQFLNPKRFPAWQGERIKMVKAWSKAHDTLWLTDYRRIRNDYDPNLLGDQQRAHKAATAFYKRNRAAMDEGCEVSWEHCYDRDTEISAAQHAYNALIDDGPEVFASECQNEPLEPEVENAAEVLSADAIAEKVNNLERGRVPLWASRIVAFVDVQKNVLPWMVCAFGEGFSGAVIDYGHWPDQHRSYFARADIPARSSIAGVTKAAGLEAQIYAALDICWNDLCSREFIREDGAVLKVERGAPDANWGDSTDIIYEFCRRSPHSAILTPSHGKYVGATSKPFRDYAKKAGDRIGLNWRMPSLGNKRSSRYVVFDTNFWKSFVQSRLSTAMGGAGCLSLFGTEDQDHRLLADHLTAEQGTVVTAKGRSVIEWKIKPHRPDNDWLDCLVGCHVLASMQGIHLAESESSASRAVKRIKLSDIQKQKRANQHA